MCRPRNPAMVWASSETDYKLAQTIAGFLGRHMES